MSLIRRANYHLCCWIVRNAWRLVARLHVEGAHHVPRTGPCILIANHQSYLDPLLIQAVVPRVVHAMAKSTQFASSFMRFWMPFIYTFPVRRYETDPQAVRTVLRRLAGGNAVMVYVEGERTWDGRLQTPRLGTIRLLLKAGVPIIPCRVDGAYEAWPRWDRKLRPGPVSLRFGEPIRFPKLDSRREREVALPEARTRIMAAIAGSIDAP